jgi:PAP2 superfamily
MRQPLLGAGSYWGPSLVLAGLLCLAVEAMLVWQCHLPTILEADGAGKAARPRLGDRLSVHFLIYAAWGIGFGAVVWRGVPRGAIDPRLGFERNWPVSQSAEWIYLSSYLVPLMLPWLPVTRESLRRYALNLWWLMLVCGILFLVLPVGAPPRPFQPGSLGGSILSWDTSRPDFAASSLPSFHVCWGLLCAALLATLGRGWAWAAYIWAAAVAASCLATGAHALADVAAAMAVFWLVASGSSPLRSVLRGTESRLFARKARLPG